jgi:hypothetical protein
MRRLTRKLRTRTALLIALVYAFCVLAPAATLALTDSPSVFHCLPKIETSAIPAEHGSAAHMHADNTVHEHTPSNAADHHADKNGKADAGTCCGLFCISGLAHNIVVTLGPSEPASSSVQMPVKDLTGRAPHPLHRPPIA